MWTRVRLCGWTPIARSARHGGVVEQSGELRPQQHVEFSMAMADNRSPALFVGNFHSVFAGFGPSNGRHQTSPQAIATAVRRASHPSAKHLYAR